MDDTFNQHKEKVLSFKRAVLIPKRAYGPAAIGYRFEVETV